MCDGDGVGSVGSLCELAADLRNGSKVKREIIIKLFRIIAIIPL